MTLTPTQRAALSELRAATDENIRYGGSGYVRSFDLGGSREERSPAIKRQLMEMGLVEGEKHNPYNKQGQWTWRITDAGRAALALPLHEGSGE